jgi:hypothetical protein
LPSFLWAHLPLFGYQDEMVADALSGSFTGSIKPREEN